MSNKAKHDINWRELKDTLIFAQRIIGPKVSTPIIPSNLSIQQSHHSGRVVIHLDRFMYLRESFEAIVKEHDIGPMDYNEAMSDVDVQYGDKVRIYLYYKNLRSPTSN